MNSEGPKGQDCFGLEALIDNGEQRGVGDEGADRGVRGRPFRFSFIAGIRGLVRGAVRAQNLHRSS